MQFQRVVRFNFVSFIADMKGCFLNWCKAHYKYFLLTFVWGAIVHFQVYANDLQNPDAMLQFESYIANDWELSLGRWGLAIIDFLSWGLSSPILSTFFVLIFFSLSGILLTDLFNVHNKIFRRLIPMLLISSPFVSINMTYYYCSDAYALAFLLGILSVLFVLKLGKKLSGILFGSICLMASLSIYQSNIGVAASLSLMVLVFQLLRAPNNKKKFFNLLLRLLTMGGIGVGLYYGILQAVIKYKHINMADYKGANNIGFSYILKNFFRTIKNAYLDFYHFFFRSDIMVNSYFASFFYLLLSFSVVLTIIYIFWRIRKNIFSSIAFIALLALLPVACNLIDIAAPDTRIMLLTSSGLNTVVPFCVSLTTAQFTTFSLAALKIRKYFLSSIGIIISVGFIWSYSLITNADAMLMRYIRDQQLFLANRICAQVEKQITYPNEMPLLIAGIPQQGNYYIPSKLTSRTNIYARFGLLWGFLDTSLWGWEQLYLQYFGMQFQWCSLDQYRSISASQEFAEMPLYPEEGSIAVVQDTLVVKLCDTSNWI